MGNWRSVGMPAEVKIIFTFMMVRVGGMTRITMVFVVEV
jgi:hypothetical protein